jgi:hypothetical protein
VAGGGPAAGGGGRPGVGLAAAGGLVEEGVGEQEQQGDAEGPHELVFVDGLDPLGELFAHHGLEHRGDLIDARAPLGGAHDGAACGLGDGRELGLALGAERGGERLTAVVGAPADDAPVGGDLGDTLGGAPADLHDVNGGALGGGGLGDGAGVALEVFAVGDEHHDAAVVFRLGIAAHDLAPPLERPGDGGAADGHVVRLGLAQELGDGGPVGGEREPDRLAGERDGAEARARQLAHELAHLDLRPLDARGRHVARVHALREVEHDDDVEVGGGHEALPAAGLRAGEGDEGEGGGQHREHALDGAAGRGVEGDELAEALGRGEAGGGARPGEGAGGGEGGDQQRGERAEEPVRGGEGHGNLRRSQARKSASSATSRVAGKSKSGKSSSYDALCASKRVFSSRSSTSCMLRRRASASLAT